MSSSDAIALLGTAAVLTIMVSLGLATRVDDIYAALARTRLLVRALVAVLVIVPAVAVAVTLVFDLAWAVEVAIALMAISPAAPVALRRSVDAGSHRGFAITLQVAAASLAVFTMPLAIALLNPVYAGRASIAPAALAAQVFTLQLVPLVIGIGIRRVAQVAAERFAAVLARAGTAMLLAFLAALFMTRGREIFAAPVMATFAMVLVSALALAIGHVAGGPDPDTRTATAIACAARNAGLVLLVLSRNTPRPEVVPAVLSYVVWSAVAVTIYLAIGSRISAGRQGSSMSSGRPA